MVKRDTSLLIVARRIRYTIDNGDAFGEAFLSDVGMLADLVISHNKDVP